MAGQYDLRGVYKDRVYTVKSAARSIGVCQATFRQWQKDGLRMIMDQRPYLVRGADLIDFLSKRSAARKMPLAPGQFFCMRCKVPRFPSEGSLEYQPNSAKKGRLSATCDSCGGQMGRFCGAEEAEAYIAPTSAEQDA